MASERHPNWTVSEFDFNYFLTDAQTTYNPAAPNKLEALALVEWENVFGDTRAAVVITAELEAEALTRQVGIAAYDIAINPMKDVVTDVTGYAAEKVYRCIHHGSSLGAARDAANRYLTGTRKWNVKGVVNARYLRNPERVA